MYTDASDDEESEHDANDDLERETTSEVGDTQCDGEWWLGSNSKEDGSSLLLIFLFLSVVFMWFIHFWNLCDCYNILFIFETYVIVTTLL